MQRHSNLNWKIKVLNIFKINTISNLKEMFFLRIIVNISRPFSQMLVFLIQRTLKSFPCKPLSLCKKSVWPENVRNPLSTEDWNFPPFPTGYCIRVPRPSFHPQKGLPALKGTSHIVHAHIVRAGAIQLFNFKCHREGPKANFAQGKKGQYVPRKGGVGEAKDRFSFLPRSARKLNSDVNSSLDVHERSERV